MADSENASARRRTRLRRETVGEGERWQPDPDRSWWAGHAAIAIGAIVTVVVGVTVGYGVINGRSASEFAALSPSTVADGDPVRGVSTTALSDTTTAGTAPSSTPAPTTTTTAAGSVATSAAPATAAPSTSSGPTVASTAATTPASTAASGFLTSSKAPDPGADGAWGAVTAGWVDPSKPDQIKLQKGVADPDGTRALCAIPLSAYKQLVGAGFGLVTADHRFATLADGVEWPATRVAFADPHLDAVEGARFTPVRFSSIVPSCSSNDSSQVAGIDAIVPMTGMVGSMETPVLLRISTAKFGGDWLITRIDTVGA